MGETFQKRISALLLSNRRHARYVAVLVCSALVVVLGVTATLMRPGQAKTHEEVVLDCQYSGNGAHTHDASCYDADGNLVCPLEEREYHVHDDSCYASETYLVCGLEEGAGAHAHDESCYDEEGNLVCGLEESAGHVHTDECWQTDTYLACGKDEVADEHVHGEGCFKTIVVDDGEDEPVAAEGEGAEAEATDDSAEAAEGTAEDAAEATAETKAEDAAPTHPAQEFKGELKEKDENGEEHVVLTVAVKAPEGALPAGSTMKVAAVNVDELAEKTTDAIKARFGEDATVTIVDAVDIKFLDKDGNEIDPAKKVEVKITSDAVKATDEPTLVHIDKVTENGEVVNNVAKVNADEKDTSIGNEDSIKFESDKFSPYVVTEAKPGEMYEEILASMPAQSFEGETEDLTVLVEAPEGAFPEGTTMTVEAIAADEVAAQVESSLSQEGSKVRVKQAVAADIKFFDAEGNEIEPLVPVTVKMSAQAVRDISEPVLVHMSEDDEAQVVSDVAMSNSRNEALVGDEDTLIFQAETFSPYAIIEVETLVAGVVTASGDSYVVTVSYSENAEIPEGATLEVSEVTEADEGYDAYVSATEEAVGATADYIRLLDISIMMDGEKIQPAEPVDVKIELADADSEEELSVVHFADGETEGDVVDNDTEAVDEGAVVTFEAEGFSLYAITSRGTTTNLNGKTFALVNTHTNNAMQGTASNNMLAQQGVTIVGDLLQSENDVTYWTFTSVGTNQYNIQNADGNYLNISTGNTGRVSVSATNAQALTVAAGTGTYANEVRIYATANNTNYYINNSNGGFGRTTTANSENNYFTLFELKEEENYFADKISVQDVDDGGTYLVYESLYNPADKTYEDYIIDGEGNLLRAYDKGNLVVGYSAIDPFWKVRREPNSEYYYFYNETTGKYIFPHDGGVVVSEGYAQYLGVTLDGKTKGKNNSTIEIYDENNNWWGLHFDQDTMSVRSVGREASEELSFAEKRNEDTTGKLHTVATVDSKSAGITMRMFDYSDRNYMNRIAGGDHYTVGDHYNNSGLTSRTLASNGYPTYTETGQTGYALFDPAGGNYQGEANNLFLKSVYDATGFYEYSSFHNYAYYNNGSFRVYEEIGTPSNTGTQYYYRRGNYFPFNRIERSDGTGIAAVITNDYSGIQQQLPIDDPTKGSALYRLVDANGNVTDPNFFFGMTMEFEFMQPQDGLVNGSEMLYEFFGDDDLYIYVDGVKLLDIGGVHDALPGKIDFTTGQITYGANFATDTAGKNIPTTIKGCFQAAGIFPDGTTWDNNKVNDYFDGDTFKDFTSHTFKMFYMEHGAGASNLQMRFNIPPIEPGTVTVKKELNDEIKAEYGSREFEYKLYAGTSESLEVVTSYGENLPITDVKKFDAAGNEVPITSDFFAADGTFKLKADESATFYAEDRTLFYRVDEINIEDDVEQVTINGDVTQIVNQIAGSSTARIASRPQLIFKNKMTPCALELKKVVNPATDSNDTFRFRLWLELQDGTVVPAFKIPYTLYDESGQVIQRTSSGNSGTIEIKHGQTARIDGLLRDTKFVVVEDLLPQGYELVSITTVNAGDEYDGTNPAPIPTIDYYHVTQAAYGTIQREDDTTGATKVTVTNTNALYVNFYKVDNISEGEDNFNYIATAEFDIYKGVPVWVDEEGIEYTECQYDKDTGDATTWIGRYTFSNTPDDHIVVPSDSTKPEEGTSYKAESGAYRIKETAAPNGHIFAGEEIYINVELDGQIKLVDSDGVKEKTYPGVAIVKTEKPGGTVTAFKLFINNTPGKPLPVTGGPGTTIFTIIGSAVMAMAVTYGISSRRRREGRSHI